MHIRGHVIAMIFFSLAFYASTYSFENKLKNVNHGRFLKIILVVSVITVALRQFLHFFC